jgi:hypothetical protein
MEIATIEIVLQQIFGIEQVEHSSADVWQITNPQLQLFVILSEDNSWLRLLVPIAPLAEAQVYLEQILEANFSHTQEVRYALEQEVLWAVFQHYRQSLTVEDLTQAIAQLIILKEIGLNDFFTQLTEQRIQQIIQAAKLRGQTLETTLQNLEHFYQEGLMGGLEQAPLERQQFLDAWKYQLERFWHES